MDKARSDLGRLLGGGGAWNLSLTAQKGSRSGRMRAVFRAHNPDTDRSIAIKAHHQRLRNWIEFRALRKLGQAVPDCIDPLYVDGAFRYYAMEWSHAPLLADSLSGPDRAAALERAGTWLARLHEAKVGPRLRFQRQPMVTLPVRWENGPVGVTASRLRARRAVLPRGTGRVALLHGDFSAANFFDAGDRIVAFDREHDVAGDVHIDVGKFLSDIAMRRARDAAAGRPWSGRFEDDRRCFFRGYGPVDAKDLARLDLFEDLFLFRTWWRDSLRDEHMLDAQMYARGLLGQSTGSRPGRLVAATGGSAKWSTAIAPVPV